MAKRGLMPALVRRSQPRSPENPRPALPGRPRFPSGAAGARPARVWQERRVVVPTETGTYAL